MRNRTPVTILLAGGVTLMSSTPAFADDYLNSAVQALQGSNVYVSSEVKGIDVGALQQVIGSDDIAVVVVPAQAGVANGGTAGFIQSLASQSNHQTYIVLVGNDLEAASSVLPSGVASKIANTAEGRSSNPNTAIADTVREIKSQATKTVTVQPKQPDEGVGFPAAGVGGIAIATAVIATLVIRKFRGATSATNRGSQPIKLKASPESVREQLFKLRTNEPLIHDEHIVAKLEDILRDTEAYFARATKRGQKVADKDTANFQRQLEETNRMLDSYLDIQDNTRYYDQPKELLLDGRKAIDGLAEGVLNAVKRGNTDALLQFQTSTMVLQAERYK